MSKIDESYNLKPFKPPIWLSSSLVQTSLASFKYRKRGNNKMLKAAESIILNCEDNVRLKGSYSRSKQNKSLVIFLHGWEGSQDSSYVVSCGNYLFNRGSSIFRLNYRDHGETHNLNSGIFLSTNFNEVFDAVKQAVALAGGIPTYIVGFSLGGNFSLRIARSLRDLSIKNLKHIFAISPVVDPWSAAPLVDNNYFYKRYFLKKWKKSLIKKQKFYPNLYDFNDIISENSVMLMTEKIMAQYTEFPDLKTYFDAYRVDAHDLRTCPIPISIITALDDGIIPAKDIQRLELNSNAKRIITSRGGHNGFFQSLTGPTWYDEYIKHIMNG
ncbi:alpha/beta fold hydrolase [Hellea sp.]|nr:alpha/beta fold hydrolase [Hellea sp.]